MSLTHYKNDRTKFRFGVDTGTIVYAPTGQWKHFAITVSSSNAVNIFVNGTHLDLSVTGYNPNVFNAGWRIGRIISNLGNLCSVDGSIDEFHLWNRVLSSGEVVTIYAI